MENTTVESLCYIVLFFVVLTFVLDLLGASWAAIRKRPYKSMIGGFIEHLSDEPSLWWLPFLVAIMFLGGLKVVGFFEL